MFQGGYRRSEREEGSHISLISWSTVDIIRTTFLSSFLARNELRNVVRIGSMIGVEGLMSTPHG